MRPSLSLASSLLAAASLLPAASAVPVNSADLAPSPDSPAASNLDAGMTIPLRKRGGRHHFRRDTGEVDFDRTEVRWAWWSVKGNDPGGGAVADSPPLFPSPSLAR